MNSYDKGDQVRLSVSCAVGGVATDPTLLLLKVRSPSGSTITYTYGVTLAVIREATGLFHYDLTLSASGTWHYHWEATGAVVAAEDGVLFVRPSGMTELAFCTVTEVADFLQITIASDNASALRAIREATSAIQDYCRQQVGLVEDDEIAFDVSERRTQLLLPETPVTEIAEVVENGVALTVGDDYKLGSYGILYRVGRFWYPGIQTVVVTYSHGYAAIPEIVASICTRAAGRAYQSGLRSAALSGIAGVSGQTLGDYSVTLSGEQGGGNSEGGGTLGASAAPVLLPSERRYLTHYRRESI